MSCRHLKSDAQSMSPRQPNMVSRIRRLEKFKSITDGNKTTKILFLDDYVDINRVVT